MNRKRMTITWSVLLALLASVGWTMALELQPGGEASIEANVASRITYQGRLSDQGSPVTGNRDMTFRLYADSGCTSQVGGDIAMPGVPVNDGLFSVALNAAHDDFDGQGLWLEVEVAGMPIVCEEIIPTPYALSLRPGATIRGEQAGSYTLIVENSSTANDSKAIRGYATAATGFTAGVQGRTDSSTTGAKGVWGYAASGGQTYGVHGESNSTSGRGVYGRANTSNGTNYGVYGQSNSQDGYGVYGTGGTYGLFGEASRSCSGEFPPSIYGVYGTIAGSSSGCATVGVYGEASTGIEGHGTSGFGVLGTGVYAGVNGRTDSSSTKAAGVRGFASATSGETYGVSGTAYSTSGRGAYGEATASSGTTYGVYGKTDSTSGRGVYGEATADSGTAYGVFGRTNSPDGYAVYGWNPPGGYAGWFVGKVHVSGTLSKSAGSFKIDHPLDPENKYLSHSFVESPDMMNVYNGNAVLDKEGQAWVELPGYFDVLNGDFRYQLTCIGGFAPVYVAQEIEGNRFQIAGGEPGLKVSWQVTGIRQDPWANANRIPVEEEKPADEQGYYLNPEVYGQPASRSIQASQGLE